jgi:bifunctional non-homologous end joining protein LigD
MHTTLYYRDERSDKIYRAAIEPSDGYYIVTIAYGRRGSTLATGIKTPQALPFEDAQKIYDKLVRAKIAKGYSPAADSVGYAVGSRKATDIRPQLLNAITDPQPLLDDDSFALQRKHDGKRLLLLKQGFEITGINRRGLECGFPETIRAEAAALPHNFLLDGEAVGDSFHVFDLLEVRFTNLRPRTYKDRLGELHELLAHGGGSFIHIVANHEGQSAKHVAFDRLRRDNAEGVVFKRLAAAHSPGRPNSGGDQFKFKFVETASVIVSALNPKRSVAISLWADGTLVPAGNVTVPANQIIPRVGDIAEVRYLYAMPGSGSLYQPVYLGVRDDIAAHECTRDQLKFRQEPEFGGY